MKDGWNGPAVDAVRTPDGIVTIDNTRIAIARELGIREVPVKIRQMSDPLPESMLNHRAQLWDKLIFVQIGKIKKMGIPVYGVHEPVIHERDSHESYYSTIESEAKE